ncbi:hypothetical protein ElyMa_003845400 [Elysia marginata]|uniref:Uncharacterized protein n=1 Tax=Elysia marginata TaxID=1093978 RepID=A0AAV4FGW2_9GAST|nr:hypothetical protein ElyMa_003845400 [Elysia marginata]
MLEIGVDTRLTTAIDPEMIRTFMARQGNALRIRERVDLVLQNFCLVWSIVAQHTSKKSSHLLSVQLIIGKSAEERVSKSLCLSGFRGVSSPDDKNALFH